ncbi:hypothetical protein ACIP5Y_41745 [Nocardia sp. NPDC088792]|uniref:hypothetical protein n=1 Tax=Nocardia sp. NPDC088792 TaxID=3364332 RepID=UPI00380F73A6
MPVFHHLVRVAGVLGACAALTATAGPATAAPANAVPVPAVPAPAVPATTTPGAPMQSAPALGTDASSALAAVMGAADAAAPDWFAAYNATLDGLQRLGVEPFLYPTAAPFCLGGTSFGLAPAVAGTVPGPWPRYAVSIPGLDLSAVKAGQVLFAFVPYGLNPDGADTSGMQVAWVNLRNGRSGFTPMGSLSQVLSNMIPPGVPPAIRPVVETAVNEFFAGALPKGGVRAVPVDTGSGTVLAAMFGVVRNGANNCFFFPTVGITPVA